MIRARAAGKVPSRRPWDWGRDTVEDSMKTQGEMEAAICQGISRFEQDYMGRNDLMGTEAHEPCACGWSSSF
jgi:hypothetical protein